jgi:hypothetical protein
MKRYLTKYLDKLRSVYDNLTKTKEKENTELDKKINTIQNAIETKTKEQQNAPAEKKPFLKKYIDKAKTVLQDLLKLK